MDHYIKKIMTARVYDVSKETPLETAPGLSSRTGNHVLLKREDMQPVSSFKSRGAYNRIFKLQQQQPSSSGNRDAKDYPENQGGCCQKSGC